MPDMRTPLIYVLAVLFALALGVAAVERIQVLQSRAAVADARREYADYRSAQTEAGRLAEKASRVQESTWRARFDKEARDGQERINLARAEADRAAAAFDGLRRELVAVLAAERGAPVGAQSAAAGSAAEPTLDLFADMLGGSGEALLEVARFADAAHAAGLTCERSAKALSN